MMDDDDASNDDLMIEEAVAHHNTTVNTAIVAFVEQEQEQQRTIAVLAIISDCRIPLKHSCFSMIYCRSWDTIGGDRSLEKLQTWREGGKRQCNNLLPITSVVKIQHSRKHSSVGVSGWVERCLLGSLMN